MKSESTGENTHPSVLLMVIKYKAVGEKINFLPKMVYDQEFGQTV